jgi:hypothetical protein
MRLWLRRKRDWDACFKNPGVEDLSAAGASVVKEIGVFSGAYKTTVKLTLAGTIDPLAMAHAEGQRSVYLFIQRRLRLTDEQILSLTEKANE